MVRGARLLAGSVVLALASGCSSSEPDTCASGLTKVCLPDGTTCTCSPSCTPPTDCGSHKICRKGACAQCTFQTCTCQTSLCIPSSWSSGDVVTFE